MEEEKKFGLKFHHVGIACHNIEKCKEFIKKTMNVKKESATVFDEKQNAHICILTLEDGVRFELIMGEMVKDIVEKGMTYYHTCYSVGNINRTIQRFQEELQAIIVSKPKPARIFDGKLVAFLYTPLGIIELLED